MHGALEFGARGKPWCQSFPQVLEGLRHLRLDSLHRHAEGFRDLAVFEASRATELEYFATARRELRDRMPDCDVEFLRNQFGGCGCFAHIIDRDVHSAFALHARVTQEVQCAVAGGAEQVGLEGAFDEEIFAPAPELEHHVLHEFFGNRRIANHRAGRPHERGIPGTKDDVKGRLVTAAEPRKDLSFVHGGALGAIGSRRRLKDRDRSVKHVPKPVCILSKGLSRPAVGCTRDAVSPPI